jgi:hypothetical protein
MSLTIPITFATRTGELQLSYLDENFKYLKTQLDTTNTTATATNATITNILTQLTVLGSNTSVGDVLYVDNANNRVGIKQASPTVELDVNGAVKATSLALTTPLPTTSGGLGASTASGVGGWLDNILPSGEVSGYVLTTTGAGSYQWATAVSYPIAAADISYTPAGGSSISATNVQTAVTELEVEKAAYVAPGTSGNLMTSNGTSWISSAPIGVGIGQTWQNVTASRVMGTTYTNSTGKPIMLIARADRTAVSTSGIGITINGVGVIPICFSTNSGGGNAAVGSIIIPLGATYVLSVISSEALTSYQIWELR